MIDRMLASDAAYNGRFITGVLSTGIYCLPSCGARKPKPENVRFFDRPEAAEAAGLRACKRCRPTDFYRGQDPDRDLVEGLVARLEDDPAAFSNVASMVRASAVGSSKLAELFRRHYHATPSDVLVRRRVRYAGGELLASERQVAEIAFDAGFESLSVFNHHFRRQCRMSPQTYRGLLGARSFEISLPRWFQVRRVLAYLGRDALSPTEAVEGRTVRLGLLAHGRPAAVTVELRSGRARCEIEAREALAERAAADVHRQVLGLLGLLIDPRPFERRGARDSELARLVHRRRGLSIPQTASVFDGLVWVVCGQQVSLPVAFGMRRRLAERAGARLDGGRLVASPTAAAVAELAPEELRGLGFSRAKADYLSAIARQITEGALDPEELARRSATRLEHRLLAVRGLGPWSVHYLMMRSFALADCLPAGDVALQRNLKRFYALDERPGAEEARRLMEPFAPHRSLATFHLWALKEESQ